MANLTDLGTAAWRLRKWVNNSKEERKMPAISALKKIDRYLSDNHVEVIDPVGSQFDAGLAVAVVNNESENTNEEELLIIDTIKPIVMIDGAVIQYGQVVLGDKLPQPKETQIEIVATEEEPTLSETEDLAREQIQEDNLPEKQPFTKFDWAVWIAAGIIIIILLIILNNI